jgi:hypothetical protein
MRKGALLLAALMIAAAPTAALAAKAKAPADPNANGKKLVTAAFMQPYNAFQSLWAVSPAAPQKAAAKKPAKKKAAKKPAKKAAKKPAPKKK